MKIKAEYISGSMDGAEDDNSGFASNFENEYDILTINQVSRCRHLSLSDLPEDTMLSVGADKVSDKTLYVSRMGFTDDPDYEVEEYDTLPYIIKKPEQTPTPVSEKEHSLLWSKSKSAEEEGALGYSVSMNELGNVVAMSDIYQDSNGTHSGSVEIYQYDGSHWNKKGSTIHGESAYDYSGASIKLCAPKYYNRNALE